MGCSTALLGLLACLPPQALDTRQPPPPQDEWWCPTCCQQQAVAAAQGDAAAQAVLHVPAFVAAAAAAAEAGAGAASSISAAGAPAPAVVQLDPANTGAQEVLGLLGWAAALGGGGATPLSADAGAGTGMAADAVAVAEADAAGLGYDYWPPERKLALLSLLCDLALGTKAVRERVSEDQERRKEARKEAAALRIALKRVEREAKAAAAGKGGGAKAEGGGKGGAAAKGEGGGEGGGSGKGRAGGGSGKAGSGKQGGGGGGGGSGAGTRSKADEPIDPLAALTKLAELECFVDVAPARRLCLGEDRHHNSYWLLGSRPGPPGGPLAQPAAPKKRAAAAAAQPQGLLGCVFVRPEAAGAVAAGVAHSHMSSGVSSSGSGWGVYGSVGAVNGLVEFLDERGKREAALKAALAQVRL